MEITSSKKPYEQQAMKLVDQVLKEGGLKKGEDYEPFSGFQDLANYLFERYELAIALGKLPTASDNFMVEFAKFPKKRLIETVRRYAPPNVSVGRAEGVALVFPWKSTLFTITTWWFYMEECKQSYMLIPASNLCLLYWQDYLRCLLVNF